jgi:hypothetical protein
MATGGYPVIFIIGGVFFGIKTILGENLEPGRRQNQSIALGRGKTHFGIGFLVSCATAATKARVIILTIKILDC